ncbi:hypothetical protein FQZ97_1001030 [compost metagenome]
MVTSDSRLVGLTLPASLMVSMLIGSPLGTRAWFTPLTLTSTASPKVEYTYSL